MYDSSEAFSEESNNGLKNMNFSERNSEKDLSVHLGSQADEDCS
jgi:hypothetical protein